MIKHDTPTGWSDQTANPHKDIVENIKALKPQFNVLLNIKVQEKIALNRTRRLLGIAHNETDEAQEKGKKL